MTVHLKSIKECLAKILTTGKILLKTAYIFSEKKDFERSLEYFLRILKTDEENHEVLEQSSILYIKLKNYEKASETLEKLAELGTVDTELFSILTKEFLNNKKL